jgi:hypothetical protein
MTPEEAKQAAVEAIKAGRVDMAPGFVESVNSMALENPDFTIVGIRLRCWGPNVRNGGGFRVEWDTVSAGFGSTAFYLKDGKLRCDNEGMGREFLKSVLVDLVDRAILDDDAPPVDAHAEQQRRALIREQQVDALVEKIQYLYDDASACSDNYYAINHPKAIREVLLRAIDEGV